MTVRNLEAIFRPASVALVGASERPHSVGAVIAQNLRAAGFGGPILPVNPRHKSVAGLVCYPDVASLPLTPDLAVICTPPPSVPQLVHELGERGTKGCVVVTAGFGEGDSKAGHALQQAMLDAARPHLLRIIGPNCLGVLSSSAKLNASFAQTTPKPGSVAFVAQSGAMVTTVLDWAGAREIGFSHLVSLGDMSDVDFGDMLDWLALDEDTGAILLYIEAITHARKFLSAARAASRVKPVIAIKAGRQVAAARAAASHTGALAGLDAVYDAAFLRAGLLRVYDLDELFDAVETLATRPDIAGDRLAILTNGGGVGVLATDSLIAQGGQLATLSDTTLARLNTVLPPTWSHGNPVDIIGDADGARYRAALEALIGAPEIDAVLVLNCPTAIASGIDAARAVIDSAPKLKKPLFTNWLGAQSADEARRLFESAKVPTYDTPEKATRGLMHIVRYRKAQQVMMEVPPSLPAEFRPDRERARATIAAGLSAGAGWLDPLAAQEVLSCYGIPVPRTARVADAKEAAEQAASLSTPVVLKIDSPDITHKSDVGGVALNLEGATAVREAAEAMLLRVAKSTPDAHLCGFIVQEMIRRPGAYELILGVANDTTFGPFLLFGHGGTAVEVIDDKALALPPLNLKLAREMMARTRIWKQLNGFRDRPPAALDAIALALVGLSQLACDFDSVAELDINPLLADGKGIVALDARIRLEPRSRALQERLAIRPYPAEWERTDIIAGLGDFRLRPVRPEDAPAFVVFAARLAPEDVRMRFFTPFRTLPRALLARLTQIDYDRAMAFVLFDAKNTVAGITRLAADPDGRRAEFAVIVRSDLKGRGVGRYLMDRLIAYAKARGIEELFGDVLAENSAMLALCRDLGFSLVPSSAGVLRATMAIKT
jgi:acetyltransferase